jgi:hypothetical protein
MAIVICRKSRPGIALVHDAVYANLAAARLPILVR